MAGRERSKLGARRRTTTIAALATVVAVMIVGAATPLPVAADDGGLPTDHDAELLADLAEAEAELADELAEAASELAEDEAKATEKAVEAEEKLAEAEAELAALEAAGAKQKDLDKAEDEVTKAAEKVAKEREKATKDLAEAHDAYEREVAKAQDRYDTDATKAQESYQKRLSFCSGRLGFSPEATTGSLYNINQIIGADDAWAEGYTGAGVDVAVIDTGTVPVEGLDGGKVIVGPDLSLEAGHPETHQLDTYGHGTHIAGIIAGNDHDTAVEELDPAEFQGVAPDARIVSVKVADHRGAVDVSQVIAAIEWVIAHRNDNGLDIRVINLSYQAATGQPYEIDPLAKAVEDAWAAGIVVVAAAGNDGKQATQLANPAYDPHVIAVSAVLDESQKKDNCRGDKDKWKTTDYASLGNKKERKPDLYAPGSTVVSLRNPGSYVDVNHPSSVLGERFAKSTGTSQSTAVVSGAVAVLLQARPDLTPDEVKAVLIHSAEGKVPVLDLAAALDTDVPDDAAQTWTRSDGSGLLDAARGTDILTVNGQPLTGQNTIFGPWTGDGMFWPNGTELQVTAEGRDTRTGDGMFWPNGTELQVTAEGRDTWTGSSWTGSSWTGSSWTGSSWTGSSWTGSSWTGSSWTGSSWTGSSWTGSSWTGSSWTGSSWG